MAAASWEGVRERAESGTLEAEEEGRVVCVELLVVLLFGADESEGLDVDDARDEAAERTVSGVTVSSETRQEKSLDEFSPEAAEEYARERLATEVESTVEAAVALARAAERDVATLASELRGVDVGSSVGDVGRRPEDEGEGDGEEAAHGSTVSVSSWHESGVDVLGTGVDAVAEEGTAAGIAVGVARALDSSTIVAPAKARVPLDPPSVNSFVPPSSLTTVCAASPPAVVYRVPRISPLTSAAGLTVNGSWRMSVPYCVTRSAVTTSVGTPSGRSVAYVYSRSTVAVGEEMRESQGGRAWTGAPFPLPGGRPAICLCDGPLLPSPARARALAACEDASGGKVAKVECAGRSGLAWKVCPVGRALPEACVSSCVGCAAARRGRRAAASGFVSITQHLIARPDLDRTLHLVLTQPPALS